jgi:LAS superfamily LD-carboxypeptidase LdcB
VQADAAESAGAGAATEGDADGGVDDATDAPAPADDAAPEDDLAAQILAAVAMVSEVTAEVQAAADAAVAAQQAAAAAKAEADAQAAAAAAAAQAAAAEKAAQKASLDAYANGRIPSEALCDLATGGGHQLRCDAADAFAQLNTAFSAAFGVPLSVSDSYRSYAAQVACVRVKGYLCATPGTSNHGRGVAVDLAGGIQTFGTAQHRWMAENAGQFGWDLPDWASAGGSKPEAWHWEYVG